MLRLKAVWDDFPDKLGRQLRIDSQYIYSESKLLAPAFYFADLVCWPFGHCKMNPGLEGKNRKYQM